VVKNHEVRQLGALFPTEWKVIKFMFQTTNQFQFSKHISQLGVLFPIYGKIKHVPNHQPDYIPIPLDISLSLPNISRDFPFKMIIYLTTIFITINHH